MIGCTPSPDKERTVGTIHRFYNGNRKCACEKAEIPVAGRLPEMGQQRTGDDLNAAGDK